jgi:hypothetical protein
MTQISSQAFSAIATQANSALLSRALDLVNNQALASLETMRAGIASGAVTVQVTTAAHGLPPTARAGYVVDPESGQGVLPLSPNILQRSSGAAVGSAEHFRGLGGDQNRYKTRSCPWAYLWVKRHKRLEESAVNDATWRRVA